jgi:hypothetical protein
VESVDRTFRKVLGAAFIFINVGCTIALLRFL